jgi:hypothetical protein
LDHRSFGRNRFDRTNSWLYCPLIHHVYCPTTGRVPIAYEAQQFVPPEIWDRVVALFREDFAARGLLTIQQAQQRFSTHSYQHQSAENQVFLLDQDHPITVAHSTARLLLEVCRAKANDVTLLTAADVVAAARATLIVLGL